MKKILLLGIVLLVVLLFSCASYTVQNGRDKIVYPQANTQTETRYSVIQAEKDAILEAARLEEEARLAEEKAREEARLAEEKAREEARLAEEKAREEALRVNEYPEDLASLSFPFYYNPVKSVATKTNEELVPLAVAFLPLGEAPLTEEMVAGALATLKSQDLDIIGLTGSLENQVLVAKALGLDAVTVSGGTIVYKGISLKSMAQDTLSLQVTSEKALSVSLKDFKPVLPAEGDVEEVLEEVEELERIHVDSFIESISRRGEDQSILFLTSFAPATSDWSEWTDMDYRTDESFLFSDILEDLKWSDTYAATHFSVETDPGVTRVNGAVQERLDFLYTKGILPVSSVTVPLERTDIIAIVANYLLP